MPLYEYLCRDCGRPFEKMVRMAEKEQAPTCPSCGSPDTRKQISSFATRAVSSGGVSSAASSCGSSRFS